MAAHVSPNGLNGNNRQQLHLPLPASRKSFMRSLPLRIGSVEDELNQVQLRLAAVEAQPEPNSSDPLEERFALLWHIVEQLLKPERRRPRRRSAAPKTTH